MTQEDEYLLRTNIGKYKYSNGKIELILNTVERIIEKEENKTFDTCYKGWLDTAEIWKRRAETAENRLNDLRKKLIENENLLGDVLNDIKLLGDTK
jgi:hypothetical protein